jgi:hypothetical protein
MPSAIDPTKPVDGLPAEKAELRNNLAAAKNEIEALQSAKLESGDPIDMQGAVLSRAELRDFSETSSSPAINAGVLTLDLEAGNVFEVALSEDVISLELVDPPAAGRAGSVTLILKQDATGGRTVAWPGTILWPVGSAPIVSPDPFAIDVFAFVTSTAGATWYGFPGGQGFA